MTPHSSVKANAFSKQSAPAAPEDDLSGSTAMVIDGNPTSRAILVGQLRDFGMETVIQCSRLADARRQLEYRVFDVVLCEQHFHSGGQSGQDLLDDLRRNQLLPFSTVFIMVTGEATYAKVAEAAESALDGYLLKPHSASDLGERLRSARLRKLAEGEELVGDAPGRAGALFAMQGERPTKQAEAAVGEVVAVSKLDVARAGQVLGRKGGAAHPAPPPDLPPRNAALAIAARDSKDEVRLSAALHKLCEEDAALDWGHDDLAHETVLRGVNDEHLGVVLARLQRRYGIAVNTHLPRIAYRESIRRPASQRGRHKKQSGGHGQFGDVVIEIAPRERGTGFLFADRITGGAVPRQWIPAVEQGVRDAMVAGPLGFAVVDVAVTLVDGSYHAVDSSELAFRIAGRLAMGEALAAAQPYLLEPVCRLVVDTPAGSGSKAGSVLSSRRGQILGLAPHPDHSGWERVEALLPEAALAGLDAELRSLSQGLAEFTVAFDHLAELAGKPADEVVRARRELAPA